MFRMIICGVICLSIPGCASTQVNYNTLDIASTYDTLITKQVVFNVLKTYDNEFGLPSYVKITAQSAQTTDAINPTLSFPFTPTRALAEDATSVLTGKMLSTAGSGVSLQAQANWQQGYTISPVDDPDQLRRLRSIFQYVTGHMTNYDFESDYPIIATSGTPAQANATLVSGSFAGSPFKISIGSDHESSKNKPAIYKRRSCAVLEGSSRCIKYVFVDIKPDVTFIRPPGCVMCDFGTRVKTLEPSAAANEILLEKNPRLVGRTCETSAKRILCKDDLSQLFFYLPNQSPGSDAIALPSNGLSSLYVKGPGGLQAFYELALFSQEAASQGTGSPSSGGQSDGRKSEPLQRISVPVSGGSTAF